MVKVQAFPYQMLQPPMDTAASASAGRKRQSSFSQSLEQEYAKLPVRLSRHARERMDTRHIHISALEWQLIHSKMQEAKKMGINDSLVLTKDAALVVNTSNQTVITAMGLDETSSRIFSNIDGTIVINH